MINNKKTFLKKQRLLFTKSEKQITIEFTDQQVTVEFFFIAGLDTCDYN